jgi:hypothetical protein
MEALHRALIIVKRGGDTVDKIRVSSDDIDREIRIHTEENGVGFFYDLYELLSDGSRPFHYETRQTLFNGKTAVTRWTQTPLGSIVWKDGGH